MRVLMLLVGCLLVPLGGACVGGDDLAGDDEYEVEGYAPQPDGGQAWDVRCLCGRDDEATIYDELKYCSTHREVIPVQGESDAMDEFRMTFGHETTCRCRYGWTSDDCSCDTEGAGDSSGWLADCSP